jgi:hypothetical protein
MRLRLDVSMDPEISVMHLLPTVPYFDRQGVHEIYRKWRKLFDSYTVIVKSWQLPKPGYIPQ